MSSSKFYEHAPIRVALMGLGRAMFDEHYPILRERPNMFKVVAACDVYKTRRDIVEKDYPTCRMFRKFSDMLDEQDIDLVVIASCTEDHVRHAMQSLKRGYWTLLESPVALTSEDAQFLRAQDIKAKNRLMAVSRTFFSPEFHLAKAAMGDGRLGRVYQIRVRSEDYVRRDDWQCIQRMGGGAAYYAMPDLILQALKLLPSPPIQMWSDLKRIASLGDAEDYAHLCLKTREQITADIEFNGGCLPQLRSPAIEIRGERGAFWVEKGATSGTMTVVEPGFVFPRRRSSVSTPSLDDPHEKYPVSTFKLEMPDCALSGPTALWRRAFETIRLYKPFPLLLDDALESIKFAHLMKKTSPLGK